MAQLQVTQLTLILAAVCGSLFAHVLPGGEVLRQVTGRMYFLEPESGEQARLGRRHIEDESDNARVVRLALDSEGVNLDMTLTRRSVWTEESRAYERRGTEIVEVPLALDPGCFLAGSLDSGNGSASFSYCGGLSGFIQTPEMEYLVEQSREAGSEEEFPEVTVSLVSPFSEPLPMADDDELVAQEEEERKYFMGMPGANNGSMSITKRNQADITAEIAVYADKNYADHLKSTGKNTLAKATTFFVNKWNTIAGVYGDKAKVGIKFVLQLKHVEVWWNNPNFYKSVQSNPNLRKHLDSFCSGTKGNKADHRMLYTAGVGGGTMGLAWVGGICNRNRACSIVKSKTLSNVRVELHEFGHSLGFKHEPQMQPCSKPDGFMGWKVTYKFNDCYRRHLLNTYKQSSRNCLRQVNLNKEVLNG